VVGADRNLALIRGDLNQVRQVAHAYHATINDVLLAVTAGGLRGLLLGRGEPVDDLNLRVSVPVTLRPAQLRDQARGNRIGQMVVPLPVGMADPGRLLAQIAAETAARKAQSHPSVGAVLRSRIARRVLLKVLDRQPVNITTADVPGPPRPLYLAGARLLEVFPVFPLVANVSLGVGALSYAEQFNIMVVADRNAFPDLDVFASNAEDELRVLSRSTGHRRPGHGRPVDADAAFRSIEFQHE
jgi:diacylglycerol O-acyltransferase